MYKDDWMPDVGDEFDGRIEKENRFDQYAVLSLLVITWSDTSHKKFQKSFTIP